MAVSDRKRASGVQIYSSASLLLLPALLRLDLHIAAGLGFAEIPCANSVTTQRTFSRYNPRWMPVFHHDVQLETGNPKNLRRLTRMRLAKESQL